MSMNMGVWNVNGEDVRRSSSSRRSSFRHRREA
jgi:hypothetical protein